MKVVILAGGLGSRLSEETSLKPKPLVEIGEQPMLWHIMKIYAAHGFKDFVLCLGYKGDMIKRYFLDYHERASDLTVDLATNTVSPHSGPTEDWRVTLVDTGVGTQTGGRLKRIARYLDDEPFCMTYGDAVTDLDINSVVELRRSAGTLAAVTAVRPLGRFGAIRFDGHTVTGFDEKPAGDGQWINGGFFVLSPNVLDYIRGDDTVWEQEPMARLTQARQMSVHHHTGFWHCMDTLRDKKELETLWATPHPPWRKWE